MSQQSRGTPNVKQESFNHVNPQMVFSPQQPQRQLSQQQQQQQQQQQSNRPNPLMFMQPNSSSALQHQYINDDSLAGSSTFADNELAESLGYGNLALDPFTYSNSNGSNFDNPFEADPNAINNQNRGNSIATGKSFPLRLQGQNNAIYAPSPSDFTSFSPEFGSPVPAPIPFNRRPGQMSMSLPQFGGTNALHNHAALMVGAGSLTASPSTPGFVGSFGGGYPELEGGDAAKQAALKEKRQKRRESHNAVERRRRDNINEKIQELAAIIPDEFMTPPSGIHGPASPLAASPATHHASDGTIKHNKGVILRKSVDYIRSLQDVVRESQRRARRLEEEVKRLGGDPKLVDQDDGSRRESISNIEDEESWLDEAFVTDDSPGMMMD